MSEEFSIGKVSELTGINVQSIRHYERVGVIPEPIRKSSGHRVYTNMHLGCLNIVSNLRNGGAGLDDIKGFVNMINRDEPPCRDFCASTQKYVGILEQKRRDLEAFEQLLIGLMRECNRCKHQN